MQANLFFDLGEKKFNWRTALAAAVSGTRTSGQTTVGSSVREGCGRILFTLTSPREN